MDLLLGHIIIAELFLKISNFFINGCIRNPALEVSSQLGVLQLTVLAGIISLEQAVSETCGGNRAELAERRFVELVNEGAHIDVSLD